MRSSVGRPIDVKDVLSRSTNLLMRTPVLLIPQGIVLVIALIEDLARAPTISALNVLLELVVVIATIIVMGAYPSLVQEALRNEPVSIGNALKHAARRFWPLLIAGILVGLLLIVGFILLIVPGIIFLCWYAYTVPAIMLENKGALAGMSASKAFGRDKKLSTFIIAVVVFIVILVIAAIDAGLSLVSPPLGRVVDSILMFPVEAWVSIIITYTYITYGPASVQQPSPQAYGLGEVPPPPPPPPPGYAPMPQPSTPATSFGQTTSARTCKNCGAPLEPDARFCGSCGQPV